MKWSALPKPAAERLIDLEQNVTALISEADQAEKRVAFAREIINGRREVERETFERQRDGFKDTLAAAQLLRQKADSARGVLQQCRAWIDQLPPDSKLLVVQSPSSDLDLAALKAKLASLRSELAQLVNNPPVSSDITKRVDNYVAQLAASALPFVRGFHNNGALDVRWPASAASNVQNGNDCDTNNANPLLLCAALNPTGLAELIMRSVKQTQPLSASQHAARRSELEHAINELSYTTSAALARIGELPDPQCAPWHHLGLKDVPVNMGAKLIAAAIKSNVRDVHV